MHLHVHIVPRFRGDSGFMEAIADTKIMPQTVDQVFKRLKKEIKMLD
jgi:ATP adenylyltransferase